MEILPEIDWNRLDMPFIYKDMILVHAPEAWYPSGPPHWWRIIENGIPTDSVIAFEGSGFAMVVTHKGGE